MEDDELCAGCELERKAWRGNQGQGYQLGDDWYCCHGCAAGRGCTCGDDPVAIGDEAEERSARGRAER